MEGHRGLFPPMSFILEALKKVDRERHQDNVPTLYTVHRQSSEAPKRIWPWALVAALLVNALILAWMLRSEPSNRVGNKPVDTGKATKPSSSPDLGSSIRGSSPPPPAARPIQDRGTTTVDKGKAKAIPQTDRSRRSAQSRPASPARKNDVPHDPIASPVRREEEIAVRAESVPPHASRLTPHENEAEEGEPRLQSVPLYQQLPEDVRNALPALKISLLAYSVPPSGRFIYLNSRKYGEGDLVDGKVKVHRITRGGAILEYQGQRFLLQP
jgi:general secretion pathway protein B